MVGNTRPRWWSPHGRPRRSRSRYNLWTVWACHRYFLDASVDQYLGGTGALSSILSHFTTGLFTLNAGSPRPKSGRQPRRNNPPLGWKRKDLDKWPGPPSQRLHIFHQRVFVIRRKVHPIDVSLVAASALTDILRCADPFDFA